MASSNALLPCPSWIWSNNSDIHAAKDRSWFGDDYTPLNSFVNDIMGGSTQVVGIGTVDLPTKTDPTKTGPRAHGILRLNNVLHAPGLLCNIIGRPVEDDYKIQDISSQSDQSGFIISRSNGRSVAYFKPLTRARFFEVRLSGPPVGPKVGPSPLNQQGIMLIHAFWPNSEREKFIALQAATDAATDGLTDAEKTWLKERYGGEYRFLKDYS
ncbi:hypothetical protein QQZ08_005697 [Neonectria magnoliae]|uniref:HNH nuclease domain-containing protein n=1 Tax=Neonectria magnoliae TaxID=2732573 RepID=A0ABR1I414_9HYPO